MEKFFGGEVPQVEWIKPLLGNFFGWLHSCIFHCENALEESMVKQLFCFPAGFLQPLLHFFVLYFFRHLNEDFQFLSSALSQLSKQCVKSFTVCYLCTKQRPFSHCQLFAQIFKHIWANNSGQLSALLTNIVGMSLWELFPLSKIQSMVTLLGTLLKCLAAC